MSLEALLLILAILGGLDLSARGPKVLSIVLPRSLSLNARIWRALADKVSEPTFRQRAITSRIEEVLNQTVFALQPYLPRGWLKRAKVNWMGGRVPSRIVEGEVILRINPSADGDHNLMRSLWAYFSTSMFPDTRDIIPTSLISGIALAIARAGIENSHPYLVEKFDNEFLPTAGGSSDPIWEYFADCARLNEYGFLLGPLLREIDFSAKRIRFSIERDRLLEAARGMIGHMLGFQPLLLRTNKPTRDWMFKSTCGSYAFILVSRPPSSRPGVEAYVKRAREDAAAGVERIYLIGRGDEREFMHEVIGAITQIRELRGREEFRLFRDYWGNADGIAVLFELDEMVARLKLPARAPILLAEAPVSAGRYEELVEAEVPSPVHDQDVHSEGSISDPVITTSETSSLEQLREVIEKLIEDLAPDEGGWVDLSALGTNLKKRIAGFEPESYGSKNLASMLRRFANLEIGESVVNKTIVKFVRKKDAALPVAIQGLAGGDSTMSRLVDIVRTYESDDGYIFLGQLGHYYKNYYGPIDYSPFEVGTLRELVRTIPQLELEERGPGKTYVRLRD